MLVVSLHLLLRNACICCYIFLSILRASQVSLIIYKGKLHLPQKKGRRHGLIQIEIGVLITHCEGDGSRMGVSVRILSTRASGLKVLLDAGVGRTTDGKRTHGHPVATGTWPNHEIIFVHSNTVAWRQDKILAVFTLVRTGDANIGNPATPEPWAEPPRPTALFCIKPDEAIASNVVRHQFYGSRIHQI